MPALLSRWVPTAPEGHELGRPARPAKAHRATCLLTSLPTAGQPLPEKRPRSHLGVRPGRLCLAPPQEWRLLDGESRRLRVEQGLVRRALGSAVHRDTGRACRATGLTVSDILTKVREDTLTHIFLRYAFILRILNCIWITHLVLNILSALYLPLSSHKRKDIKLLYLEVKYSNIPTKVIKMAYLERKLKWVVSHVCQF